MPKMPTRAIRRTTLELLWSPVLAGAMLNSLMTGLRASRSVVVGTQKAVRTGRTVIRTGRGVAGMRNRFYCDLCQIVERIE